jgi:hypothetical protein
MKDKVTEHLNIIWHHKLDDTSEKPNFAIQLTYADCCTKMYFVTMNILDSFSGERMISGIYIDELKLYDHICNIFIREWPFSIYIDKRIDIPGYVWNKIWCNIEKFEAQLEEISSSIRRDFELN